MFSDVSFNNLFQKFELSESMLLQKNAELRRELENAQKQVKQLEKVRLAYCYICRFIFVGIVGFAQDLFFLLI